MLPSLQLLLDQLFDYAGLFPPAGLPMEEAAAEFGAWRTGPHASWVRRMVIPVGWLPDLIPLLPSSTDNPWRLSVLGTSLEGYSQDLNLIDRFEAQAEGKALVEAFEVKGAGLENAMPALKAIENAGFEDAFIELPLTESGLESLHHLVGFDALSGKARTGGLEAASFPTSDALASWINECSSLDLNYKFTAGLHHALPFHDSELKCVHHGFINVSVAAVLAPIHDLSRSEIAGILDESDPKSFWFSEHGLGYRDWEASLDDIEIGREQFVSIGSCSLQEPLDDLVRLNWVN